MLTSLKEIKEKISLNELNIFSTAAVISIDYNYLFRGSPKMKTKILEWLVEASKLQAKQLCDKARKKLHEIAEAYRLTGFKVLSSKGELVEACLSSRALFGSRTFGYTLFEVGLEFDPYLNLPVIPGSSIKGALRSAWRVLELGNGEELVFGRDKGEGKGIGCCIFSDAYPIEPNPKGFILYPDVITPHYQNDVMDERRAEPKPIPYLSIAPGVKFGFIIAVSRTIHPELFRKLRQAFLFAFKIGLGAKTNVGYGVFTVTSFNIWLG